MKLWDMGCSLSKINKNVIYHTYSTCNLLCIDDVIYDYTSTDICIDHTSSDLCIEAVLCFCMTSSYQ